MAAYSEYYYNGQIRSYFVQFCTIFGGMQVMVGKNENNEPRLIPIPIVMAQKERVAAAIKAENTQNKMIRLPMFSAHIADIQFARDRQKGVGTTRRSTFMPSGGVFPTDVSVVEHRMPVPYDLIFELNVYASNQDQMMQILEQIMMIFDPILQVQTSDDYFDWTKITTVELTNIQPNDNYPIGIDRRILERTLTFTIPAYVSCPAIQHQKYVADIIMRLGAVSTGATTWDEIHGELDAQGVEDQYIFKLSDITLE